MLSDYDPHGHHSHHSSDDAVADDNAARTSTDFEIDLPIVSAHESGAIEEPLRREPTDFRDEFRPENRDDDDDRPMLNNRRHEFGERERHTRPVDRSPPIEGYKELTVPEILGKIETMTPTEVRAVREYEGSHRRRKTLLVKLERLLRGFEHASTPQHEHAGTH